MTVTSVIKLQSQLSLVKANLI